MSLDAATVVQPAPIDGDSASVTDAVIKDLYARREMGRRKYGTELRAENGRDALIDAYQEALDLAKYLKQEIMKREADGGVSARNAARSLLVLAMVDPAVQTMLPPHLAALARAAIGA